MIKIIVIFITPLILFAQVDIFGYYEGEFDHAKLSNETYNYGYNKLRLDIEGIPDASVTIGANINVLKYTSNITWNMLDFLPETLWKPLFQSEYIPEEYWVTEFPFTLSDTLYLDNIYLRANFKKFDLTVGKQQISLGTGYAWNPIDIFNFKQLLDPTYEQTGVNTIRIEVPFGSRTNLDLILSPGIDWNNSAKMIQLKTGLGSYDLIGTFAQYNWKRTHFDLGNFEINELQNERTLYGGAIVGEIAGVGIWAEGAWSQLENSDDFGEFIFGTDYTFENGLYILMEYLYNENGLSNSDELDINRYLQYFNGEIHSLMRDYLFGYLNYPISDLVQFSLLTFTNINDHSAAINPQITWDMFQDVSLSVMYSHFIGDKNTEFGVQDWGWRIRLRGYF